MKIRSQDLNLFVRILGMQEKLSACHHVLSDKGQGSLMHEQPNNPLHGMTLEMIINSLVEFYGWGELGIHVKIRCFNSNPSVKSSLAFLRKTPWARKKVEDLYLTMLREKSGEQKPAWPYSK